MASAIYIFLFQENIDSGGQVDSRGEGWGRRASILLIKGKTGWGSQGASPTKFIAASTDANNVHALRRQHVVFLDESAQCSEQYGV